MIRARCSTCGKVCHPDRKAARKAARLLPQHTSVYKCGAWWHVGTLPTAVIRGELTRDDLTTRPRSAAEVTARRLADTRPSGPTTGRDHP